MARDQVIQCKHIADGYVISRVNADHTLDTRFYEVEFLSSQLSKLIATSLSNLCMHSAISLDMSFGSRICYPLQNI